MPSLSWLRSRGNAVGCKELPVAAARKQQRLFPAVGISLDRAEEDNMVAAIISVGRAALKIRNTVGENRRVTKAGFPFDTGEFIFGGFGESIRQCLLRRAEHVDRE